MMDLDFFHAGAYFTGRISGKMLSANRRPTAAALKSA